jgi:hypothetical protein
VAVKYTHSAVVITPSPDVPGAYKWERVPVHFNGRIWVDYKRRQYHAKTGKRMSAPHTNRAVLQLDTLRDRPTNGSDNGG